MILQRQDYRSRVQTRDVPRKIPRVTLPENLLGIPRGKRIDLSPRIMPKEPLFVQMKVHGERNGTLDVFETLLGKDGHPTDDITHAKSFNTLHGAIAEAKRQKRDTPGVIESSVRTRNEITVRATL